MSEPIERLVSTSPLAPEPRGSNPRSPTDGTSLPEVLLEMIPAGAVLCAGPDGRRWQLNARGRELLGLGPEERSPATAPFSLRMWLAEDEDSDPLRTVLTSGRPVLGKSTCMQHSDGSVLRTLASVAPLQGTTGLGDGFGRGAIAVFEQLPSADRPPPSPPPEHPKSKSAEHTDQLAAVGALTAGIIHEINNPLNSIMVNAELGLLDLEKQRVTPRLRRVLRTIVQDVKRCGSITHSILELARSDRGAMQSHDPNEIVRAAAELVRSYCQMHDATLEMALAEVPRIPLNRTTMEHAIVNLLRNAIESGGRGVRLRVGTRLAADEVLVTVSDDGPGIEGADLERIFQPLYSAAPGRRGTGLGLSLVQRIVEAHGGSIDVASIRGAGSTFCLRIPRHGGDRAR